MGKLSLLNEKISNQVATLTEQIWNAALKEVDDLLQVKMQYIKEKQVVDLISFLDKNIFRICRGSSYFHL